MTEPMAQDTETTEFRTQVLAAWAKVANDQNWDGQFNTEMRNLGYSQEEINAARDAGKLVHKLTITIRTNKTLAVRGAFGSLEDTVANEVRRGFNLVRGDSVTVEHAEDVPA